MVPIQMDVTFEIGVDTPVEQPIEWSLGKAYPNPFNPTTRVNFSLRAKVHVKAAVYNLLGQQVAVLADKPMTAGYHSFTFDGANLASGMYFMRFDAGPIHDIRKMVLLK